MVTQESVAPDRHHSNSTILTEVLTSEPVESLHRHVSFFLGTSFYNPRVPQPMHTPSPCLKAEAAEPGCWARCSTTCGQLSSHTLGQGGSVLPLSVKKKVPPQSPFITRAFQLPQPVAMHYQRGLGWENLCPPLWT